jgi:hypothetical protein
VETAVSRLHGLLDATVETLMLLSPDTASWEVPSGCVDRAFYSDERFSKAHRRVREVLDRLRDSIPVRHHEDVDDVDTAVRRAMSDAAEVGWRIGMAMSRTNAGTTA